MKTREPEKEFEEKYNRYGSMLYKIAFLHLGNASDAEDVLQDVFTKYIFAKKSFNDAGHEKAWFIRVTQNRCLDLLKKHDRQNISIDEINILHASFEGMSLAVQQLQPQPEFLAIDGNRFYTKLKIPFQCVVKGDGKYANIAAASVLAKTFRDDRCSFTEEQVKAETARCLGCGASFVDPNKCLGCGVCTTRCKFDAIRLKKRTFVENIEYADRPKVLPKFIEERQKRIEIKKMSGQ